GRRDRADYHGHALSAWGVEMEPDRTPHVQPDQRQLGWGAADQLRDHLEVYPHDAVADRLSLPGLSGPHRLPDATARDSRAEGSGTPQAAHRTPQMELHHLAPPPP